MLKESAVASIGEQGLLLPTRIKAALAANDRLKLHLSVIQAAVQHAEKPKAGVLDLSHEQAAAGVKESWIDEMVAGAVRSADVYFLPGLPMFCAAVASDLGVMAKPVVETARATSWQARCAHWMEWLRTFQDEALSKENFALLERGDRDHGDSVHLLVMDLHKQLNRLAATLATEEIDGAHAWNLQARDRERVAAFMRGIHRTANLKFDHPGLDTAATRDGNRLVLQNDIGTNDAHVLVMQVENFRITLTYSDLHQSRFEFFRRMLGELGAAWSVIEPRMSPDLNAGATYFVGTANFACDNAAALDRALEEIGARIVFLIDWNRARKRLQQFVSKPVAIEVLATVARLEAGHMAWLKAGGERMLFTVMQAAGDGIFRLGDRLDAVLGESGAREFLVNAMSLSSRALLNGQPVALIEDEVRVMLTRQLQDRASEFDIAGEHAGYCHELAAAVRDTLAHGCKRNETAKITVREKTWERRADEFVEQAREAARRHPRWQSFASLIAVADDIADELEEANYLLGLIAEDHQDALRHGVQRLMLEMASTVLKATEDYVKALTIARSLARTDDLDASNAFLDATWRVVLAERSCDEQLRALRRIILKELSHPAEMMLASDLAHCIEAASDALMVASFALREVVLARKGAVS